MALFKDQKMRIQTAAITEYFNKLHLLRAEGIQTETAEKQDLKVSKFVNPEMTIELTVNASEEKSQKVKIEFKILDDSNALMVSSVNKPIYKISKSKVNDFIQDGHFRDKNIHLRLILLWQPRLRLKNWVALIRSNIKDS